MTDRTCTVDGCDRDLFSTGWCSMHYARVRRHGSLDLPARPPSVRSQMPAKPCIVDGCASLAYGHSRCAVHHHRHYRHGTTDAPRPKAVELASCGTYGALVRHRKNHEPPCEPCLEAGREYDRARHEANPTVKRGVVHKRDAIKRAAFVEYVDPLVVFERDHWTCQACRRKLNPKTQWPHPLTATLDHIIPLTKGGQHSYAGTQTLCARCNTSKGNRAANDQLRLIG